MGFSTLDYVIVVLYLVAMAGIGLFAGGRQASSRDYFLGKKDIPWWAACLAIVATETSTLTFISIPGLAYATNLNFLQVTIGYLLGRIAVSFILLPAYARGDLTTAYQFLGGRFGGPMRSVTSITFMFTRVLADGVRLFATAIPLTILLKGWNTFTDVPDQQVYIVAILVLAGITLSYTFFGGVRAVIWTDVVQMIIYLGGAIGAVIVIASSLDWSFGMTPLDKLSVLNTGFSLGWKEFLSTPYTLPASLLGGAVLSMASHGTDQIIVQRLFTVRTLAGSQKALIGSGVLVILQFLIFLLIGALLFAFYHGQSLSELGLTKTDEIFPMFIIQSMPSGLSGIIIAGLLAAAMSTLSGSVNSLAATSMNDIYIPLQREQLEEKKELLISRMLTLFWCVVLVALAIFFITNTSTALVELALGIASVTYGGLLGSFLLGVLSPRIRQGDAMIGFASGIAIMIVVVTTTAIAWTWYTIIGTSTTLIVGHLSYFLTARENT